jgi:hypothetical protein
VPQCSGSQPTPRHGGDASGAGCTSQNPRTLWSARPRVGPSCSVTMSSWFATPHAASYVSNLNVESKRVRMTLEQAQGGSGAAGHTPVHPDVVWPFEDALQIVEGAHGAVLRQRPGQLLPVLAERCGPAREIVRVHQRDDCAEAEQMRTSPGGQDSPAPRQHSRARIPALDSPLPSRRGTMSQVYM